MRLERVEKVISMKLGELPLQEKGASFIPAGIKRKMESGDVPENTGYTESYTGATLKIKVNTIFKNKFMLEAISDITDDTLIIITTEGKEFLMAKAWVSEPCNLEDGETEIIFNSALSPRTK